MAGEAEIESLLVRLTGDGSEYQRMLQDAAAATQQSAKQVEDAAKKVEGFGKSLEKFATNAITALGALGTTDILKTAFSNFAEAEGIGLKLSAILEANGRDVEALTKEYGEFAAALEETTTMEDDAVLSLFAVAEGFDVTGAAAKRAVKDAVALAAVTGGSAESLLRLTTALAKGDTERAMSMARMVKPLQGITNESEFAAKAQNLIASGMKAAEAEAKSSAGTLAILSRDWGNLLELFGEFVAIGIKPVVAGFTEVVAWLKTLDKDTVETITIVAGLTAGFLALVSAMELAKFAALFNPVSLGIIAAIAAITVLVKTLGGVEETWKIIKDAGGAAWEFVTAKAQEFLAVVKPITDAAASFFDAFWERLTTGAKVAWDGVRQLFDDFLAFVKPYWDTVAGAATTAWETIRDGIQEAFLVAEFTLRNFGAMAALVWTKAQLDFVTFANELEHFFTVVIPEVTSWFLANWKDIFQTAFDFATTVFKNLGENIIAVIKNLPDAIRGQGKGWSELWKPLTEGFESTIKELPNIPEREIGAIEQALRDEFDAQGEALGQSFAEFRDAKLAEFAVQPEQVIPEQTKEDVKKGGKEAAEGFGKAAKAEMAKFDAALAGSAEALSRIAEFRDKMADDRAGKKAGKVSGAEVKNFVAVQAASPEAVQRKDDHRDILVDIRDILRDESKKPALSIETAGI